jgi:DnaJ family protein A protein 2
MTKEISIQESICGVEFTVKHLDGTFFNVKSGDQIIKPEQILTLEDKGMPFHKNPFKLGNLFIMFKVYYPDAIPLEQK